MKNAFLEKVKSGQKITHDAIKNLINESPCLTGRTPTQVRSHLQKLEKESKGSKKSNKNKTKNKADEDENSPLRKKKRPNNTTPLSIHIHFKTFIEERKRPSYEDVRAAYNASPKLRNYTPDQIITLIEKAMNLTSPVVADKF